MEKRIFGTECEYGLLFSPSGRSDTSELGDEELLERMKRLSSYLVTSLDSAGLAHAGEFLGNGGRFYVDRGAHPEYATPECTSIRDLVAQEKAGDRILQKLVEGARAFLARKDPKAHLHAFKNNVDSFGTTYGGHENYLVTQRVTDEIHRIIPFLVTRQVFAGAGKVANSTMKGDAVYQLAQRSDFIHQVFSDRTSEVRGIINLRKREIPRQGQARRLHVIFGDSNLSECAIALKIGTTCITLTLLEEGMLDEIADLASPVKALRAISRCIEAPLDHKGRRGTMTALDIQRGYLEKALRFYAGRSSSEEVKEILDLWGQTLDGLQSLKLSEGNGILEDDPAELKRRLDWVLKLWIISRTAEKRKDPLDWRAARLLDLRYHDLDPRSSLFQRCERLELVEPMVADGEITRAMTEPPNDTRAWLRGMIIQKAVQKGGEVLVDGWDRIRIMAPQRESLKLVHPFKRLHRMSNSLDISMEDPFMTGQDSLLKKAEDFLE